MDGEGQKRLRDRLIGRYPTPDSLSEFVIYHLGVRPDHITTADGMHAKGHNVVEWFDAQGRLGDLEAALGPDPLASGRVWSPAVLYPLQPAPHFAGREQLLQELTRWATDPADPNRVVALVAVGGTGKTALAEQVLASLRDYKAAGVLVWSFNEDPKTEAFLRAACEYFLGEAPKETSGLIERLQQGLRADRRPHVFVLDGLESVQTEGTSGRARGTLEDHLVRRLLQWLAAGLGTSTKALVTSRFPLPELGDWTGKGFRPLALDDLDAAAARYVLRKWGVTGDDHVIDAVADRFHRHALTLDVLGSYLRTYHDGDLARTPVLTPEFLADSDDLKTARLHQLLTGYAEKLLQRERDVLARLSLLPRGLELETLGYLADAGSEAAGSLSGCAPAELRRLIERLRVLGPVFRYDRGSTAVFTAHPFLRDFFRGIAGSSCGAVCSALAARLRPSLIDQPWATVTDPALLDRMETLIDVTRMAGDRAEARRLYRFSFGNMFRRNCTSVHNEQNYRILTGFLSGRSIEQAALEPDPDFWLDLLCPLGGRQRRSAISTSPPAASRPCFRSPGVNPGGSLPRRAE
jgi:hypothetical protein